MTLPRIWPLVNEAVSAWIDDDTPSMGAALAYYTVFSIAPLLLIVIAVAGLVFGQEAARGEIMGQLSGLLGTDSARAVQDLLESVNQPGTGVLATLLGIVVLLIGATTVFAELQSALDRIWRAPERPVGSGLWALLRSRLLSLGMVMGLGFLLMVSLVVSAGLSALGKWWTPWLSAGAVAMAQALNVGVSMVLLSAIFAMIYKWMPRVKVAWSDVGVGAVITALLFTLGKSLIGLYIGRSGVASAKVAASGTTLANKVLTTRAAPITSGMPRRRSQRTSGASTKVSSTAMTTGASSGWPSFSKKTSAMASNARWARVDRGSAGTGASADADADAVGSGGAAMTSAGAAARSSELGGSKAGKLGGAVALSCRCAPRCCCARP